MRTSDLMAAITLKRELNQVSGGFHHLESHAGVDVQRPLLRGRIVFPLGFV